MPMDTNLILMTFAFIVIFYMGSLIYSLGLRLGLLAATARILWLLPIFTLFFPKRTVQDLQQKIILEPVRVFIDDSESMKNHPKNKNKGSSFYAYSNAISKKISAICLEMSCEPNITYLSQLDPRTNLGYSPISLSLTEWLQDAGNSPWIIMTDGGEMDAERPLATLRESAKNSSINNGLIIAFDYDVPLNNITVAKVDLSPFAFENTNITAEVSLQREGSLKPLRIQLQAKLANELLATEDQTAFAEGEKSLKVKMTLPPLPRGQHLLEIDLLPTPDETFLADNTAHESIEVLPNTIGVLHLLGSPSWDGRFLRRYLKSEPKYDLISFYILRDPFDSNLVNERELSLIPFPVDRLFKQELSSFKVLIIQNFALHQFLQVEYQQNLVNFVKNGGSLFYLGGPRAFTERDLVQSPLKEIFPFTIGDQKAPPAPSQVLSDETNFFMEPGIGKITYNADVNFKISLAERSQGSQLVDALEEWRRIETPLNKTSGFKGVNLFSEPIPASHSTLLLNAVTPQNQKLPLAVASYPGKGRALWLFTDSLWRLSFNQELKAPRSNYDQFLNAAMRWLLRQEMAKPILVKNFHLAANKDGEYLWSLLLSGPAVRYLKSEKSIDIKVCDLVLSPKDFSVQTVSTTQWSLSGKIVSTLKPGNICTVEITINEKSIGLEQISYQAPIAKLVKDSANIPQVQKLRNLAEMTHAELISYKDASDVKLSSWLGRFKNDVVWHKKSSPEQNEILDPYWFFTSPLVLICFLGLFAEVWVRRLLR